MLFREAIKCHVTLDNPLGPHNFSRWRPLMHFVTLQMTSQITEHLSNTSAWWTSKDKEESTCFLKKKLVKTKNLSLKRHWAVNIEDFTPEVYSALPSTLRLTIDGTNKDNISENLRLILLKCWHYMREYNWERSTQDAQEVKPVQCQTAPLDFQHRHLRPLWGGVLEYKRWPAVHLHSYPHWYLEIICSVVIGPNLWPKSISRDSKSKKGFHSILIFIWYGRFFFLMLFQNMLTPVDDVEVLVLVDNKTDSLSRSQESSKL